MPESRADEERQRLYYLMPLSHCFAEGGMEMLKHFLVTIAGVTPDWNMNQVVEMQMKHIAKLVRRGGSMAKVVRCMSIRVVRQMKRES